VTPWPWSAWWHRCCCWWRADEFRIPQAVASSITGHPHWGLTATLGLADLPMAAGAPGVTLLVFLRLRRLAGLGALATAIGQIAAGPSRPSPGTPTGRGVHRPALRHGRGGACLLSPGPDRGLALLTGAAPPWSARRR